MTVRERILRKVVVTPNDCWHWIGANNGRYGYFNDGGGPWCRNGHLRTAANTYERPDGRRECRDCRTVREAA